MHTECIVDDMDLAVKKNLAERLTLFEVTVLDLKGIVIEVFVCFIVMGRGILLQQKGRQFFALDQRDDLNPDRLVVVLEVS